VNIQGTFREHSGNIQGTFREHSGNIKWTFSEHSGNIQGAFREHSGNIQGTFREHSGTIQWELSGCPWASIPTARSTLKKLPRLTQNTTCKHEYVRRGSTRPNDVSQE
jgi:hypothetical protein